MSSTLDYSLWQSLDNELVGMLDNFSNLVQAAHIPDEGQAATGNTPAAKRAPGELLEIWAEKLSYSGLAALHLTSQLKKSAVLCDFDALIDSVRTVKSGFAVQERAVDARLPMIRQEVQQLLSELETSYYSSQHRGRLVPSATSDELRELSKVALECGERRQQ
jgi:hypothetical protein